MRRLLTAAACGLVLGVAGAAGNDDNSPETRAYIGLSFGGAKTVPHELHYGLRIDQDVRLFGTMERRPDLPLMQLDFTRAGFNVARLNGMPVVTRSYRLQQTEAPADAAEAAPEESAPAESAPAESAPAESAASEEPVEPVEEQGFFGKIGSWFGGLFGGDDEESAEEEAAAPAADDEETAEGTFMGYDAVDWATLAVGAVGLGYVVSEVTNGDDDADPGTGGSTPPPAGPLAGNLPIDPTQLLSNLPLPLQGGPAFLPTADNRDPQYQEWLDGGSGHMGDLGVAE